MGGVGGGVGGVHGVWGVFGVHLGCIYKHGYQDRL